MNRLYPLTESTFKSLIEPLILKHQIKSGRPPIVSHYKFFCSVLYVLRTGVSWRDLPAEYGNWYTIYTRYKRWSEAGFFGSLLYQLQAKKGMRIDMGFVDGSIIPLHRHGGGTLKK